MSFGVSGQRSAGLLPVIALALGLLVVVAMALAVPSVAPGNDVPSVGAATAAPSSSAGLAIRPAAQPASAIQFDGPSFGTDPPARPTVEKPQSKLWFHAGSWWAAMLSDGKFTVHQLDESGHRWVDTGTIIDARPFAHLDALPVDDKVYIVGAGPVPYASHQARLTRLSFDAKAHRYTVDSGFPVDLSDHGMISAVIARDGAGWLWLVAVIDGKLRVAHTEGDDRKWSVPRAIQVPGADRASNEAAIIAVGGEVHVMWSTDEEDAVFLATHRDGDPADDWVAASAVVEGVRQADDHMNLKAAQFPDGWHIYAMLKTSLDDAPRANPLDAQLQLLEVLPDGSTRKHLVGRVRDRQSRAIILIDSDARRLYVAMTYPFTGGRIYMKSTSLDRVSFPSGRGDLLIGSDAAPKVNDPTSTKQNLTAETGLVVVAADETAGRYATAILPLDGGGKEGATSASPSTASGRVPSASPVQ
ncbi:MAG: hypothetical protein ACJ77O_09625 [Chloroflexota bacterium]